MSRASGDELCRRFFSPLPAARCCAAQCGRGTQMHPGAGVDLYTEHRHADAHGRIDGVHVDDSLQSSIDPGSARSDTACLLMCSMRLSCLRAHLGSESALTAVRVPVLPL
mgnify:CR=1 FL=1